jgi:curved DNA-binding protein CbpA
MSPDEARAILGVEPGASVEAVQAAYRRLIRMAHPDQGGTRGLAAQLNLARDVLMGR